MTLDDQTLEFVFEGITTNSKVDHFTPMFCQPTDNNPRVQLARSSSGAEYTQLYQEQLRNIIEGYKVTAGQETRTVEGMFPAETPRGTFANWTAAHNTVKGG